MHLNRERTVHVSLQPRRKKYLHLAARFIAHVYSMKLIQKQLFSELQCRVAHVQLIRPEKTYRLWCVIVFDLETS